MSTATAIPQAPLRLVPADDAPAHIGTLETLRWSVDQMEAEGMRRARSGRGRSRRITVREAREVLYDVQDVVALVGLYLPRKHPTQQLVGLICHAIDHELGHDPHVDHTLKHRRRVARIAAAMAAEAKGGA